MTDLAARSCKPCEAGVPPLTEAEIETHIASIPGWKAVACRIEKRFRFRNYFETISFVNAVAWLANRENHHPDLEVGYRACKVKYRTHAIDGLSENDFICAAKIDQLLGG